MSADRQELYEFGDFRLDVTERRLEHLDGSPGDSSLPEKAFQTLVYLVRRRGSLVEKDDLLNAVWPDAIVEEGNLGKAVHSIRQALGEKSGEHKYIETVPKHGYRFVAPVRQVHGFGSVDANVTARSGSLSLGEDASSPARLGSNAGSDSARVTSSSWPKYWVLFSFLVFGIAAALLVWQGAAYSDEQTGVTPPSGESGSRAHDLYIRGKVKVSSENREDTEAGIKLLEEAVALDPNLAEAFAHLARGYNTMAFKYSSEPERKRFHENAEVAIEKALTLNPDLAEAHFARGLILWTSIEGFPHEQAIQSYRRSLELDPRWDETHHQLSLVYSHIGLMDEAEKSVAKALEMNPNNTLARFRTAVYLQYRGQFQQAIDAFKSIPRDHTPLLMDRSLAETLIQLDRDTEAEAIVADHLQRYPNDEGGSFTGVKAVLKARAGNESEAEELARHADAIGRGYGHFHHTAYNIASVYAILGKPDEAVAWLEIAVETGFPNYPYFQIDPNLNRIRTHPRFLSFMTELQPRFERYKSFQ